MSAISMEASVLLTGVGMIAAVVGSHVRMEGKLGDLAERFKKVEKVVGLNGTPPAFMRTGECALLERMKREEPNEGR